MKKRLLAFFLFVGLGSAHTAQAQAALVNLIATGLRVGVGAAMKHKPATNPGTTTPSAAQQTAPPATSAPAISAPEPHELVLQRTPADKLPKRGATQITALEAELDRCRAAMLADPAGLICPPAQRTALQNAAVSVARAQPSWDLRPYQQETAFYLAEDARRQQASTPAAK